jgi:exodeoxyribonuclease VII large subunit
LLARRVDEGAGRAGDLGARLIVAGSRALMQARHRFEALGGLLESYSYERVLERGFALVRDAAGHPVTAAAEAPVGARLGIRFHDGEVAATVTGAHTPAPRPPRRKDPDGSQGSLL